MTFDLPHLFSMVEFLPLDSVCKTYEDGNSPNIFFRISSPKS